MTTQELKQHIQEDVSPAAEDFTPEQRKRALNRSQHLLQTFATFLEELELPKRYTLKTGLLWDSQDATDGFHEGTDQCRQVITQTVKELKGQDNG